MHDLCQQIYRLKQSKLPREEKAVKLLLEVASHMQHSHAYHHHYVLEILCFSTGLQFLGALENICGSVLVFELCPVQAVM